MRAVAPWVGKVGTSNSQALERWLQAAVSCYARRFSRPDVISSSPRLSPLRAALVVAVLLALVLAQSLGRMHRLAHVNLATQAVPGTVWSYQATSTTGDWLQALFGWHHHKSDCESYDQLTHGDALKSVAAAVQPMPAPAGPLVVHRAWNLAAQAAGFLARGPPPT